MANCNHDCKTCGSKCEQEVKGPLSDTHIKNIIAVLSGKGGVGKSMVSSLLSLELNKQGYKVGIMDCDITGPSIPKMFGLKDQFFGDEEGIFPLTSAKGIKVVSVNNMLENEDEPLLWRGPILANVIKQFYTEVHWGELDYLIIDMPPGTSDVAISVIQQIPVDQFLMVTTPSKLVSMIVSKAINMANTVNKKVLGLVENMAYIKCNNCGNEIKIYNEDDTLNISQKFNLPILARLPLDCHLSNLCDNEKIEEYSGEYLKTVIEELKKISK